jgi:hypothetical protein
MSVVLTVVKCDEADYEAMGELIHAVIDTAGTDSALVIIWDGEHPPKARHRAGLKRLFGKRETRRLFRPS